VLAPSSASWALGVDPGKAGALAAVLSDRSAVRVLAMPVIAESIDLIAIRDFIESLRTEAPVRLCVLEKAGVMPKQGAVSGFTTGLNYGRLSAALELSNVPLQIVTPASWKAALGVTLPKELVQSLRSAKAQTPDLFAELDPVGHVETEGAAGKSKSRAAGSPPARRSSQEKKAAKELAIATARRFFPEVVMRNSQDGIAEALLMAEAARRLVVSGSMKVE
jgi:hypothetical protein